ncbi:Protein of unknown function [Oceanobacillus limi]|uniref:DUF3169 domain-containing protein n=1 Tax=Oceanobacillus limi TaxID=930131 RepID=A0A1H9Y782_9BACI|nr:DUF3169 family protein [Oceanobacillus limi]SES64770.1 Protein of unknown function [Oceanobacillus limi]
MKSIVQFLISGVAGFFVVYGLMNFSEVNVAGEITVISIIAISFILITMSVFRFQQIKALNTQNVTGDEEDEVEDRKYKLFADYSLSSNSSFYLSILALSLSLIITEQLSMTIVSIILLVFSFFLLHYMGKIIQYMYPDRKPNYAKSILDVADDGEKHVILDGLYKSQSILNISLIAAITLATVYSMNNGESQTFSIILMAVILLVVNSKYLLVIRNK